MFLTVEIKCCRACKNVDHSGGFTKGGARPICGHDDACKVRKTEAEFNTEYPTYAKDYNANDWKYHWYNRIVDPDQIPDWCPLKHGSAY